MTPGCLSVTNHLLIFSMLQGKAAFFCNQLRAIRHKPRCLTNLNKIQYIHQVFLGGSKRTLDKSREPTISGDSTYKGSAANHCYNSYTSLATEVSKQNLTFKHSTTSISQTHPPFKQIFKPQLNLKISEVIS